MPSPHEAFPSMPDRRATPDTPTPKRLRLSATPTPHGSYKAYYTRRLHGSPPHTDDRVPVVQAALKHMRQPSVLDIGCNAGALSIYMAMALGASSLVGVDINDMLVRRARGARKQGVETARIVLREERQKCTRGDAETGGAEGEEDGQGEVARLPQIKFRCEDFAAEKLSLTALETNTYDAVLCLSVTKWVHLHGGDAALKRLFERIYACLKPGGILVLEPQPRQSYKRARQRGVATKTFAELEMKPEKFVEYLMTEGFERSEMLRDVKGKGTNFNRPILAFYKAKDAVKKTTGAAQSTSPSNGVESAVGTGMHPTNDNENNAGSAGAIANESIEVEAESSPTNPTVSESAP